MGELGREAGAGVHLQQDFGQVHPWHPGRSGGPERYQAGWLVQLVEGGQGQRRGAVRRRLDPHAGVPGQPGGGGAVGGVQAPGHARHLLGAGRGHAERPAHGGAGRLPGGAVQHPRAGVGIAQAGRGEEVAPAQGGAHPVHHAQGPGFRVHGAVADHAPEPARRHELDRQPGRAAVALPQVVQGGQQGLGGRRGAELGDARQAGQEAADAAVLREQLVEVGVVRRPGQRVHPHHRRLDHLARHRGERRRARVALTLLQQHGPALAEGQRRGVQVA